MTNKCTYNEELLAVKDMPTKTLSNTNNGKSEIVDWATKVLNSPTSSCKTQLKPHITSASKAWDLGSMQEKVYNIHLECLREGPFIASIKHGWKRGPKQNSVLSVES